MNSGGTEPLYTISIAAKLIRIERPDEPLHPQTLRMYERLGLVTPQRVGKNRLYSDYDVQRVRQIQALTDLGVNLAGVEIILGLKERLDSLEAEREYLIAKLRQYE
ncbi:MAG: MerR family transcriptional regulator [Armatimonadaceae bacterium]